MSFFLLRFALRFLFSVFSFLASACFVSKFPFNMEEARLGSWAAASFDDPILAFALAFLLSEAPPGDEIMADTASAPRIK